MIPIHKQSYTFTEIVEVQEETRKRKTTPTQPQPKNEDVQITELPVDYTSDTIIPSIVTVTQPEEKPETEERKIEEEIIVVEENELGEVVVKKSRQPKKQIVEKEIVEVVEEETVRKRKKKKVSARKATENEEIHEEENVETLHPFETNIKREVVLETSSVVSETVPTRQVSEMFSHSAEAQTIDVNIIPLTAIGEEQILVQEKEQQYSKVAPLEFIAKKSLDTSEAYQVRENVPESAPSTFESTFQPTFSTATRNITPSESIVVTEVHENQMPSDVHSDKLTEDIASIKYTLQEAATVTETEAITTESQLKEAAIPKSGTATEHYRTNEGIFVEQTQDLSTTTNLDTEKVTAVTSKLNIDAIEPLVVQEIYTDSKPGKHLPEAFVATEIANTKFIPQNQIITSETIAPETEGEFMPGRLPPSQKAVVDVTVAEGLLTHQIQTDDKETTFQVSLPETTTASSEMTLSEGVTVSTTDSQMPSKELTIDATEMQQAAIEILPKESLTTTSVVSSESGREYVPGELPQSKTAQTQITCLEISTVSNIIVQESEQTLTEDTKPSMGVAEKSIKQSIPLEVSEVSTADVPENFTNYPKYKTQEVSVEFETQDAKQIIEIQTQEREEKYEKSTVLSFTPSSTITEAQNELSVIEAKSMESEAELPAFELPSSQKGKQTPAHVFPTSTTEEITPQISASQLAVEIPESKTVNITQTTLAETMVSQTITADSLGTYKEVQDINKKQADITITVNEGVTITEVLTDEKEKECLPKDIPKQYQASIDIDCQKAAHIAEVLTNILPQHLEVDTPLQGQARPLEVIAEGIQVLQHQTAEKENEYKGDILPETKHPTYELQGAYNELSITETYVQESESGYTQTEKPKEMLATENIATQEVAIKSQTEMVCHADEMQPDEPTMGKAKKYARPLQELIVTEATPVDFHKELPKDVFPYEKTANVNLIPGQQLTVTEVTANDREEVLLDSTKPSEKYATTSLPTREVAINEETLSHMKPDELETTLPVTDTATPHQDVAHHITQLQPTVAEKESIYTGDVKPDSKVINIEFEEGRSITITEVQTQDTEGDLSIPTVPSLVHGKAEFVPCTVAVKEEVATDDSVTSIVSPTPKMTEAQVKHTLLEGLIQTETKVEEIESDFSEALPDAKTATDNILLEETVVVSSTVAADKEKLLETAELPVFSHANCDVGEQNNIQTTEVHPSDTIALFDNITTKEAFAETTHIEQHGISQSETTPGESEQILSKDVIPEKKIAGLSIDVIGTATTEEVVTEEKENTLLDYEKPIEKCADKLIDGQPVAETTETIVENTLEDITMKDYDTKTADITQSTYESISESTVTLGETEAVFETSQATSKKADVSFSEAKGIGVFEITPADKEQNSIKEMMATTQTAVTELDTLEAVQEQEISVHEGTSDLALIQPTSTFAGTDIRPFNAAIASESVLHESEAQLKQDVTTNIQTADISIREAHSIGTTTYIETSIKESILEKAVLPDTKHAATEITDLRSVATQFEVYSDTGTRDIHDKPVETVNANVQSIAQEAITELQPIVVERESIMLDSKMPDAYKVLVDVESCKGLEVSEVTLGETNKEYKSTTSFDKKLAEIAINGGLHITQTETVVTSETSDDFQAKKPERLTADKTSSLLCSIEVSENVIHESGEEMVSKPTAPISQAELLLEPGKPVQHISEVFTEERETDLTDLHSIDKKQAIVNIDTHEIAEIEEITSQTATDEFKETRPVQNVANVKTGELEYLTEHQPQICETEADIDVTLKTVPKVAEVTLQEIASINVSEIHNTEKEKMLQDFEMPQSAKADKKFLGKEAMIASEIYSTYDLTDIAKEKENVNYANVERDYLEGLTNTEMTVVESETTNETKFTPESKQASIIISELSSISVEETHPHDDQQEHTVEEKKSGHATEDYSPLQSVETTSVFPSEDVSELPIKEAAPSYVNVHQTTLDTITLSENIVHEKEATFEPHKVIENVKAHTAVTEQQSIDTTEIFIQEMEDKYIAPKAAEPQAAVLNILPQRSLEQFQVETQSALKELEASKPYTDEATSTHSQQEAVEISENLLHEQETKLESKQPDSKIAEVAFLPQKYVCVTEAISETKEVNLENELRSEAIAEKSFLPQSAVEVIEAVSDQVPSNFTYQAPVGVQSTATTLPHDNIEITDLILGEKENEFPQPKIPKIEMATTCYSATGAVASISETPTDIKEAVIPSFQVTPENATVVIIKQTPVEEIEINTSYKLEHLPADEIKSVRKAISRQTTFEGVTQTEVDVQEKAQHIDTEYEESKSATISIVTSESISTTEVNFEEQEADKVIPGKASEKSAQPEIQGQNVAIVEETITLQSSSAINNKQTNVEAKAKETEPTVQYGVIVSEQRSTGELEPVPCIQKLDFKTGRVLYEGVTTTPLISEIHPEEKEGKYLVLTV